MASARDVILIGALIFVFGMGFFVINYATKTMVTSIVAIPVVNATPTAVTAFNDLSSTVDRLDYLIFGLFIAMILGFIVAGYYVGGHPIFMFFYFLMTVIGVIFSMQLANVWYDVANAAIFGTTISSFPITNNLITYLPIYTAVIGTLGVIVMFAKPFISSE